MVFIYTTKEPERPSPLAFVIKQFVCQKEEQKVLVFASRVSMNLDMDFM